MYVPAVDGVPEMDAGGDADRLSPGGSCPLGIDHLNGATPLPCLMKKFCR